MDLGSSHGTHVDEQKLAPYKPTLWKEGMIVRFGSNSNDCTGRGMTYEEARLVKPVPGAESALPKLRLRSSQEADIVQQPDTKRPRLASVRDDAGVPPICQPASSSNGPAVCKKVARKVCDKCDGDHPTEACPNFKGAREGHKDAWLNYGRKHPLSMGCDGGNFVLRSSGGQVVAQPGDGSCLFHSLRHGLARAGHQSVDTSQLRRQLARFIMDNPRLEIAGDTLEEWVQWDANTTCDVYARRMAQSGWGGGIEMAACSHVWKVNVHVYEQKQGGHFRRISCFDHPDKQAKRTVNVLYRGRMHFDALVVRGH